jgi:hypothetical protein
VSERAEAAISGLFSQSAPLSVFTMPAGKTFNETSVMRAVAACFEREFDRGSKNEDRFFRDGLFTRMSSDEWRHHNL